MSPAQLEEAIILLRQGRQGAEEFCAGVTDKGEWVRLTPLSFHRGQSAKHLKRWDRVRFTAKETRGDTRLVVPHSITIIGECPAKQRAELLDKVKVTGLAAAAQRTLVLLQPKEAQMAIRKKTDAELKSDTDPFAYHFSYRFVTDDGPGDAAYHDKEMDATLTRLTKSFGEAGAVSRLIKTYGREYLQQGVYFIMTRETASAAWQIAAVMSRNEVMQQQPSEEALNVVC